LSTYSKDKVFPEWLRAFSTHLKHSKGPFKVSNTAKVSEKKHISIAFTEQIFITRPTAEHKNTFTAYK